MPPQHRSMNTLVMVESEYSSSSAYSPTQQTTNVIESKKLMSGTSTPSVASGGGGGGSQGGSNDSYAMHGVRTTVVQPPAIKKRTRFALSNNEVFQIPHINDMCDEEVKDIWYEKHDYDKIKQDIIPLVKRIMRGDKIEETNDCTIRGLEYRTRKGAIKRQHNKVEAITAVLDEQDRQIELDINEPELIMRAYLETSANCQLEANKLAQGDVAFAQAYINEKCSTMWDDCASDNESCTSSVVSGRSGVERKTSITKMFKQMRIRRAPSISRAVGPEAA